MDQHREKENPHFPVKTHMEMWWTNSPYFLQSDPTELWLFSIQQKLVRFPNALHGLQREASFQNSRV